MADVVRPGCRGRSRGRGDDSGRGQLIVVTGLLIAVVMVALVLLLNTAIYTENLASRGADQSGAEAIEYRATVIEGVGGLLVEENAREHGDHADVWRSVRDGIVDIDDLTARSTAVGGTAAWVDRSAMSIHNGTVIRQATEQPFESRNGDEDWTLVTDVDETRSFSMVVQNDTNLVETNESRVAGDGAFNVTLDDGSQWQLYVYANQSTGDIEVATRSGGAGDAEEIWSSDADEARINLTEDTINGDSVPELDWSGEITGAYEIRYGGGSNASGTYDLAVNSSEVVDSNFADQPDEPHYVAIVYGVDLPLNYESPTVTYRATVRLAPEELP